MPIDPTSHLPIYEQIVEHIQMCVAAGVFRPGEPLPSTRGLAVELIVNPNTVQRAYQELERQGVVRARKGLGVFVAENGHAAALQQSETAIRERFSAGVHVGRTAKLSTERIRAIFRQSMNETRPDPNPPTGPDQRSAP